MNPEQWLSLKWNGGSTMSDRWLNQSKIIHDDLLSFIKLGFLVSIIFCSLSIRKKPLLPWLIISLYFSITIAKLYLV